MKAKVPIKEVLIDEEGNETVLKTWPSLMACCTDLGIDHHSVRMRVKKGLGYIMSKGIIKYKRVEE